MQGHLTTVSIDDRHSAAVDTDTARSLRERPICRHQRRLCAYKQVETEFVIFIWNFPVSVKFSALVDLCVLAIVILLILYF